MQTANLTAGNREMAVRLNQRQQGRPELAGSFLVASPHAQGTPFARAVVLVLQQTERGALGLIIDEALCSALKSLHQQLAELDAREGTVCRIPVDVQLGLVTWAPGQLNHELELRIWLTAPASMEALIGGRDVWVGLVRQVGRAVLEDALQIKTKGVIPSRN
jgi:putative AlgH/UPF0301 family transcriptional regulator